MEQGGFSAYWAKGENPMDDMFLKAFGVERERMRENVIISPGWSPERIFNMAQAEKTRFPRARCSVFGCGTSHAAAPK